MHTLKGCTSGKKKNQGGCSDGAKELGVLPKQQALTAPERKRLKRRSKDRGLQQFAAGEGMWRTPPPPENKAMAESASSHTGPGPGLAPHTSRSQAIYSSPS